jgi:SNF2 family DNA or RNA helicase
MDKQYIFLDIYLNGTHSCEDEEIKKVSINDLLINYSNKLLVKQDAVDYYKNTFTNSFISIPNYDPNECYEIQVFNIRKKFIVTLILIDRTKINKNMDVPPIIKLAYILHLRYISSNTEKIDLSSVDAYISPSYIIDKYFKYTPYLKEIEEHVIQPNNDIGGMMISDPDFINKEYTLFDYQKRTILGMTKLEKDGICHYKNNKPYNIFDGCLSYDLTSNEITFIDEVKKKIKFYGGALIDEVGLGKTIQMLSLSIINKINRKNMSKYNEDTKLINSAATLIICPNHLCSQWEREIKKMIKKDKNIKVVKIFTKTHYKKVCYKDVIDADFVIISFNFIGNDAFTIKYYDYTMGRTYYKSDKFDINNVKKNLDITLEKLKKITSIENCMEPILPNIHWNRIIVDEFHEAFTLKKFMYVGKFLPLFKGSNKWMISGTPFDKNHDCTMGIFNFITNSKYDDTIHKYNNNINRYIKNNIFFRNTKKSVKDEFTLPPITEKIIWMKFTLTERMMYNAYAQNPHVDKTILRQLCCHPKLATELKQVLENCKSLKDIEQSMVLHYKNKYLETLDKVNLCKKNISKTERRILIAKYKIQKKLLARKKIYYSKIKLPDYEYADEIGMSLDDDSDDESDDDSIDKTLKLLEINEENQKEIKKILGNNLINEYNSSNTITDHQDILVNHKERLAEALEECDGKNKSYVFFKNMLDKLKTTVENTKLKIYDDISISDDSSLSDDSDDSDLSDDSDDDIDNNDKCPICMTEISGENVGVTNCGHIFSFKCLKKHVSIYGNCPICRKKQTLNTITKISFEMPNRNKPTAILDKKLSLINKIGTKLTNLIYYLNTIGDEHVIIFSQWDSLLKKVGTILNNHGVKNVFCKGNVFTRDKAIRDFNSSDDIKVIMLSSESAASGANLTKASKTILLDPIAGDYEYRRNMEWQAIGRMYRLGQTKDVEIVRLIVRDTIENDIYNENIKRDNELNIKKKIKETSDDTIKIDDDKVTKLIIFDPENNDKKCSNANKKIDI